jgi:SAM-dependent methyltransferase
MDTAKLRSEIRDANAELYQSSDGTDQYLFEDYHQTRVSISLDLIDGAVARGAGPKTCLDLGSGAGRVSSRLSEMGLQVVACDVSRGALASAPKNVRKVQTDLIQPFPFRDNSIDVVFMGELIEHVFDPRALLGEITRVLRGEGILLLTTPNLAGLQDRIRFLAGRTPRHVDAYHEYLFLHIRPFTASSLKFAVNSAGLIPLELRSGHALWRLDSDRQISSRMLARLAPSLGANLILLATKPAVR